MVLAPRAVHAGLRVMPVGGDAFDGDSQKATTRRLRWASAGRDGTRMICRVLVFTNNTRSSDDPVIAANIRSKNSVNVCYLSL